ncbi:RidA family protein [Fibrisoma montanum]|uniref:RidA family protein n=1 Tax=Fibrisoma montanum TaxID=2305895 RepID=A0A418MFF1_9BACT|nr:RidA family protein [Fibrisoma montanum]RIV25520.1 RidA family protein [Fibrisoma montanum]
MHDVQVPNAMPPAGHYAPAVVHNGLVFVSGILPKNLQTGETYSQLPIEEQARVVLQNLAAILDAAGSSKDKVLKTTVYVADIDLWQRVNAVYASFFGAHKPARSIVPVPKLHFDVLIELEAIAYQ